MSEFYYRIVKGKGLVDVNKETFTKHIQKRNEGNTVYGFERIDNITYYFDDKGKVIAQRLVIK